ncbi:hypothetical protein [Nocardioides marmoraquaticus]
MARLTSRTVAGVRRAWRRLDPAAQLEDQYATDVAPKVLAVTAAAQVAAAREADAYVEQVLAELDFPTPDPLGLINPAALAGWAGDGRPSASMFASSIGTVRDRADKISERAPDRPVDPKLFYFGDSDLAQALAEVERDIDAYAATIVADTVRAFESVAMAAEPAVTHYVRMVEPGACSRCVILAGRRYLMSEPFERHPRCRCTHIPATLAATSTPVSSPQAYFDSLDATEQDRVFTAAGAQAVRDGADIAQVVNARRGMERAQVFGRDVHLTREGITVRGRYGNARGQLEKSRGRRYRATNQIRLMPESILAVAGDDAAERVRLLKLHAYLG